jgi:2-aminobenzoate-CoA ligase
MSNHIDLFTFDNLPKQSEEPFYSFLDEASFFQEEEINCVERLLDNQIKLGNGQKNCIQTFTEKWTYQNLYDKANQIAHVLVEDFGIKAGNRVLLRSANNPMMVASWFGILKAGGVVVATMPLLREKELTTIIDCAEISYTICDGDLSDELSQVKSSFLKHKIYYRQNQLEALMADKPTIFNNFQTKSTDVALIGFTSGTTGLPKMTAHFHRDVLNICEAFPKYALQPTANDIFTGSPPLGFTFGLGGLVLFPFYFGASTFLIEKPSPDVLLKAIQDFKITICFTAPTAWRALTAKVNDFDISSLRKCVSAGETLPKKVWDDWYEATGLKLIDGIGATEMLHIFISSNDDDLKPGATGKVVTGFEAKIIDDNGHEKPRNEPGKLAVRGITGCKYLNRPDKQAAYVQKGWNVTGDIFYQDEDDFFHYVSRADDMIISSGYNIAAIEVESVLLQHENVLEVAVIGLADDERGMIVCAFIVLKNQDLAHDLYQVEIQDWFKSVAAPYKYPRMINFVEHLPKTETGKIQRFKLAPSRL